MGNMEEFLLSYKDYFSILEIDFCLEFTYLGKIDFRF